MCVLAIIMPVYRVYIKLHTHVCVCVYESYQLCTWQPVSDVGSMVIVALIHSKSKKEIIFKKNE